MTGFHRGIPERMTDLTLYQEERYFTMKSLKHSWLALLLALSFVLAACGAEATPVPPTQAPAVATDTVAAPAAPTDTVAAPAAAPTDTVAAPAAAPTDTVAAAAPTDTVAAPAADTTPTVAPTETPVALGTGTKTISIWHGWEGEYLKTIQSIFADYVASHPDISIQLLHVADIDKKVQNAVPAGVGPDIVAWVDDHIGQSALLGVIDPLDGMQGIDANYLSTNYVGVAKDAVTYDGKIYALPESMEAVTMIYNKKLITEDKLPKTTTELVEQAKTYNAANAGNYLNLIAVFTAIITVLLGQPVTAAQVCGGLLVIAGVLLTGAR